MASTFPAIEQRTAQRSDGSDFAFFWDFFSFCFRIYFPIFVILTGSTCESRLWFGSLRLCS